MLKDRINSWVEGNWEWFHQQISTRIAKGQMNQYALDLSVFMIESIYNLPAEKVEQLLDDDAMGWYLLTGAGIQLRSSTSPFYRIHRRERMSAREDGYEGTLISIFDRPDEPYDDSLYECFKEEYANLFWYDKEIMNKYFYEGWSLQQTYEYYNIPKYSLVSTLNKAINQIRKKCNQC